MDLIGLRVAALWAAWLLIMLFHVELGLMPLFHGCSVEIKTQVSADRLPRLFLAMFVYFTIPVLAMLLAVHAVTQPLGWASGSGWRAAQFWLSAAYTLTNVGHLIADIRIPDSRLDQVLLMLVLTIIGLLLSWEAWSWWIS
ncbi:MAG: hypothetical protein RLZZ247_123 [Cyanobacteriota bacterium]|jgi:ABC-type dipeptide/oligopeptide/nickel transport system permease component